MPRGAKKSSNTNATFSISPPNRALKQVQEYACKLDNDPNTSPEQKVKDFISVLPIFSYDGSAMREIDAEGVLDYALSGTTATLLAKRWESALLVNVDNVTLQRLLNNPQAMEALSRIEKIPLAQSGFGNHHQSIRSGKKCQKTGGRRGARVG